MGPPGRASPRWPGAGAALAVGGRETVPLGPGSAPTAFQRGNPGCGRQLPAPHTRQPSSNKSWARPVGGSPRGAGTSGKGCRLTQSPAAPLRTWGSAPASLKTRCEPRAGFLASPARHCPALQGSCLLRLYHHRCWFSRSSRSGLAWGSNRRFLFHPVG